jgi:hypothetical protein
MAWFRRRRADQGRPGQGPPPVVRPEPLDAAEQDWIRDNLSQLTDAGVDIHDAGQIGAHYDHLLAHWLSSGDDDRSDPNPDINLIGIGLGQHFVARMGLEWGAVTDPAGTEISVHGQPGDILIYPTNAVAKRWVAQEAGFIPDFVTRAVHSIIQVRSAHRS